MDNDLELVTLEELPELQEKLQPIFAAAVTNSPVSHASSDSLPVS
jgi:hypothetical protein